MFLLQKMEKPAVRKIVRGKGGGDLLDPKTTDLPFFLPPSCKSVRSGMNYGLMGPSILAMSSASISPRRF